jgi:hypothetical protein
MHTPEPSDDELDALFRQGAEHYPEELNLGAWARMEQKLDEAHLQQLVNRKVARLFALEIGIVAVLLLIWGTYRQYFGTVPTGFLAGKAEVGVPATSANTPAVDQVAAAAPTGAARPGRPTEPTPPLASRPAGPATTAAPAATDAPATAGVASADTPGAGRRARRTPAALAAVVSPTEPPTELPTAEAGAVAAHKEVSRASRRRATGLLAAGVIRKAVRPGGLPAAGEAAAGQLSRRAVTAGPTRVPAAHAARGTASANPAVPVEASTRTHSPGAARTTPALGTPVLTTVGTTEAGNTSTRPTKPGELAANTPTAEPTPAATSTAATAEQGTTAAPGTTSGTAPAENAPANAAGEPTEAPAPAADSAATEAPKPALLSTVPAPPVTPADTAQPRPKRPEHRSRIFITGLYAPELSTVRNAGFVRPGHTMGLQVEYVLTKRLRLSVGLLSSMKYYRARPTDYTWAWPPTYQVDRVDATCRITDIPVNLRFDAWQGLKNRAFVSAGLTSLLMRDESYKYSYLYYGTPASRTYQVVKGNNHPFSVLNVSAGYERQVTARWSVQAEPYLKLPLGGVGAGKVRLSSGGVFLGLKYGL